MPAKWQAARYWRRYIAKILHHIMDTDRQRSINLIAKSTGIGIAIFITLMGTTILLLEPVLDIIFPPRKPQGGFLAFSSNFGVYISSFLYLLILNIGIASFISSFILGCWQRNNKPKTLQGGLSGFFVAASGPLLLLIITFSPFMIVTMMIIGIPAFIIGLMGYSVGRRYEQWSFGLKSIVFACLLIGCLSIIPLARYWKGMPLRCPPSCENADLSGSDFSRAIFDSANLLGANLTIPSPKN